MINVRSLLKLANNDGFTLKKGKKVSYKTGYQVATEGMETTDAHEAMRMIKAYNGDCGVWFSEGVYYIDKSHRVATKRNAIALGIQCNQQSILVWKTMDLIWLER